MTGVITEVRGHVVSNQRETNITYETMELM